MTLGHWLVVAGFVGAIVVPAFISILRSTLDKPCNCAECRGLRERQAPEQRVIE